MEVQRKRSANWTEDERSHAVDLILKQHDSLFGKFRGASLGANEKERKWDEIVEEFSASGKHVKRTKQEVKKMYCNMKARAKEKFDENRKTGGGPHSSLSCTDEMIIGHMKKTSLPILEGITGGIDSMESRNQSHATEAHCPNDAEDEVSIIAEDISKPKTNKSTWCGKIAETDRSKKRKRELREQSLIDMEFEKIKAEKEYWEMKRTEEKELIEAQKQYWLQMSNHINIA